MILRGGEGAHGLSLYGGGQHHSFWQKTSAGGKVREASFLAPELVSRDLVAPMSSGGAEGAKNQSRILETKESPMITKYGIILAACALTVLGVGAANAGPCNTVATTQVPVRRPATRVKRLAQVQRIQNNTRPLTQ